jgi:type IV pilus assembly protein PilV
MLLMSRSARWRANPLSGRSARKRQSGIALLEALVSILIFSFGLLGLIGLEARAINFSVNAEDRNRAALFANDIASSMWLSGTVNVSSTVLAGWQTSVKDQSVAGLPSGEVAIAAVAGTTNSADITIKWKSTSSKAADPKSQLTTRVTLP